ncbi:MAG TPA: phospholipid carrier-dependent glycosyltransferase [Firmicutes bacterium]|nr:phospholipid carrier-dependent glycosyltransferase [Bacillota bacterium]
MNGANDTNRNSHRAFSITPSGAIILIVLVSVVLRVWGVDFGLPQTFHPDEPVVVTRALYGVATGDWNPQAFHWPSFQLYFLGFFYQIWFYIGKFAGFWEYGDPDFISFSLHSPGGFYYLGRLTTVLFGAGCVLLTYYLGRRFLGIPGALAASAVVAFNPIMTRHSRFITPDIPGEFFFLAALLFIDSMFTALKKTSRANGERSSYVRFGIYAAVMVGLGAGTKYPVGLVGVPMIIVALFAISSLSAPRRIALAIGLGIISLLLFFITTPFAILDSGKFLEDISVIGRHVRAGHIGMEAQGGIWLISLRQLIRDSGWLFIFSAIIGLIPLFTVNLKRTWPLLIALIISLAGLAPLNVFSDRYLVPLIPFAALGVGWMVDLIILPGTKRVKHRFLMNAVSILFLVAVISRGVMVLGNDAYRLTLPDTREAALTWVERTIPDRSRIFIEQGGPDLNDMSLYPLVPEPYYEISELTPLFTRFGDDKDPLDRIVESKPQWVITSSEVRNRYMRPGASEEYPDLVAAFREYYRLVDGYFIEEARFEPGRGIVGPSLVIYRVPEGLWDRIRLAETTVDDVLSSE